MNINKKDKFKESIVSSANDVTSFHSANFIVHVNEKEVKGKEKSKFTKEANNKINKKPDEKIKELYANFQKIRENRNLNNEKQENPEKTQVSKKIPNKKDRKQGKSAEKEINREILDILEIFKSASKALNSKGNFEKSKFTVII